METVNTVQISVDWMIHVCGGKAVIEVIEPHRHIICKMPVYTGGAFIECTECGEAISGETGTEATKKWNGRQTMIEQSMPATKNVPKERDTMSCKKAERYGYVKAICETDKGLFNRKVEEWINLTDGVVLDASCGIIDGKTVFQAVIGGLRK